MEILFVIMLLSFVGYLWYIKFKYGVQASISESYYRLPQNRRWMFTIALWGFAIPAIILGTPLSGLAFLAGASIAFVGVTPAFKMKNSIEGTIHKIAAITSISAIMLMLILLGLWWLVLGFGAACALTLLFRSKNKVWWVETWAFITAFIGYLILLL